MKTLLTFLFCLFAVTVFGKSMVGTNEVTELKAFDPSQFSTNSGATKQVRIKAGAIALTNLDSSLSNSVYSSVTITNVGSLFVGDTNGFVMTGGGNAKAVIIQPGGFVTPFSGQFSSSGGATNIPGLITNNNAGDVSFNGDVTFNDLVTISNAVIFKRAVTGVPVSADYARFAAGTNAPRIMGFYSPGLGALLSAIDTNGNFTGTALNASNVLSQFDVIANYHASDSATTTTGSISSASMTLTVGSTNTFEIGMGVLVHGAGNAGGGTNLVANITNMTATTMSLDAPATATVANFTVRHENSAQITAANKAAQVAGGTVFLRRVTDGWYYCSGGYDATTRSIISWTYNTNYTGLLPDVGLKGTGRGNFSSGGVTLDFTYAPPANLTNSYISPAKYIAVSQTSPAMWPTSFCAVNITISDLDILTPQNPDDFATINMANATRFKLKNAGVLAANFSLSTNNSAIGVFMPQIFNAANNGVEDVQLGGFNYGVIPGEYTEFNRTYICFAQFGLYLLDNNGTISGNVTLNENKNVMYVAATSYVGVKLLLNVEPTMDATSAFYRGSPDIVDPNHTLHGDIFPHVWVQSPGVYTNITITSGYHVNIHDLPTGNTTFPDGTNTVKRLGIGTIAPIVALEMAGTGLNDVQIAQGTTAANGNTYISHTNANQKYLFGLSGDIANSWIVYDLTRSFLPFAVTTNDYVYIGKGTANRLVGFDASTNLTSATTAQLSNLLATVAVLPASSAANLTSIPLGNGTGTVPVGSLPNPLLTAAWAIATNATKNTAVNWVDDTLRLSSNAVAKITLTSSNGSGLFLGNIQIGADNVNTATAIQKQLIFGEYSTSPSGLAASFIFNHPSTYGGIGNGAISGNTMRIGASGALGTAWPTFGAIVYNVIIDGSVGIGTTLPDSTEQIYSPTAASLFKISGSGGTNLFNVTSNGNVTALGTGTFTNGVTGLGANNLRTNIAQFDVTVTDFVIGTRYTNSTRRSFVAASFQLAAAVAGTAAVTLNVEQVGVTNKLTVSSGPLAGLTTIEPLALPVGPGAFYYFTDTTSGAGATASIVAGTSSKTDL